MSRNSYFKSFSISVISVFFILSAVILIAATFFSAEVFRAVFIVLAFLFLLVFIFLLIGFLFINRKFTMNNKNSFLSFIALRMFMPFILFISNTFDCRKEEIRRVYIKANNEYVFTSGKKYLPGKLLVILPHCLQWSECIYRIREGLNECHKCNKCNLGKIKDLVKKHGIMVKLVTGGTSARSAVKDLKPDFVIAVACERDLSSGIMDVRGLPVYGIINDRPNGPCRDTFVNTEELENVIKHFAIEKDLVT